VIYDVKSANQEVYQCIRILTLEVIIWNLNLQCLKVNAWNSCGKFPQAHEAFPEAKNSYLKYKNLKKKYEHLREERTNG